MFRNRLRHILEKITFTVHNGIEDKIRYGGQNKDRKKYGGQYG